MMLSEEEHGMLLELAEAKGVTASDYLRTVIRERVENHDEPFGTQVDTLLDRIAGLLELQHGGATPKSQELRQKAANVRRALSGKRRKRG